MAKYTLTVNNQASHSAYIMVFQKDPTAWHPDAMSIAWFSKFSNPSPSTKVEFNWEVNWGMSWSDSGELQPGIIFNTRELFDVTESSNKITLDYNGAYRFINPTSGSDPARIYLEQNGTIPVGSSASVGVTMSGSPVYAVQARPNQYLTMSPHPEYWVAYGNYEQGTVLDVSTVNNPLKLDYATGIYSLTTTINADGTWVTPRA